MSDRFWAKVDQSGGDDACWPWVGAIHRPSPKAHGKGGYGKFGAGASREDRRTVYAHRLAWELANDREIPAGMLACHRCDNPPCCNPAHIFIGTPKENLQDMSRKGRHFAQKKTHCKWGHEFTPENTAVQHGKYRACRACRRRKADAA